MKKLYSLLIVSFISSAIFAFDWPQEKIVQADQFYSYFGQLRGDTISNSLIFSEPSEIKAADDGKIVIFLSDYDEATDFFPSTLGNAVIIAHQDKILTVYANIDSESVNKEIFTADSVQTGFKLGMSGNSAWQQGKSSLEFQVIDTKDNTSINPRLLMPRIGKELPLYYNEIYLQDKNGRNFNIQAQIGFPQWSIMPFPT